MSLSLLLLIVFALQSNCQAADLYIITPTERVCGTIVNMPYRLFKNPIGGINGPWIDSGYLQWYYPNAGGCMQNLYGCNQNGFCGPTTINSLPLPPRPWGGYIYGWDANWTVPATVTLAYCQDSKVTTTARVNTKMRLFALLAGYFSADDVSSGVVWTSSNPKIATIYDPSSFYGPGTVSFLAPGTVTISASMNGLTSNAVTITVTGNTLNSITVNPTDATVYLKHFDPKMKEQQFNAAGNYSDGTSSNLNSTATWTTSDASVASVTTTGLATGLAPGSCNIVAAQEGKSGSAHLNVECRLYTLYKQIDARWKDDLYAWHASAGARLTYGPSLGNLPYGEFTIAGKGCALTDAAMVITTAGSVIDPGTLNKYMVQPHTYLFYDKDNQVRPYITIPYFSDQKVKVPVQQIDYDQNTWIQELNKCNAIIANLAKHYVLVTGYKDGQFIINDPLKNGATLDPNDPAIVDGTLCIYK